MLDVCRRGCGGGVVP